MITKDYVNLTSSEATSLNRYISKIVGTELSNISRPCYKPKTIVYKNDLFSHLNITTDEIKLFKSQMDKEFRTGYVMLNDQYTILVLMGMIHLARSRRKETAKLFYLFLAIKFFSSRSHVHFPKFCSDDLWKIAMTQVSPKHLFREKNGVPNALIHIVNMLYAKYGNILASKQIREKDLVRIVYDLRQRIAQSLRSFAEVYYALQKKGGTLKTSEDDDEKTDIQLLSDKISMSMCTFGQVDKKALITAINKSSIKRDIATSTILEVSSVQYKDKVKFILVLMGRTGNFKNICTETGRNAFVRKVEAGAKIGKYTARDEILDLLYSTELGYRLKSVYKSQLVIFFTHYMTYYIKEKIC